MHRTHEIKIRLSAAELAAFQAGADRHHRPLAAYVREVGLRKIARNDRNDRLVALKHRVAELERGAGNA